LKRSDRIACKRAYRLLQPCYDKLMTEQIDAILERVRHWPVERQRKAAELLTLLEEQDQSPFQLTDEQLSEARRRREDKEAQLLTLDEFSARLSRFGL
jgi:hypothetical protein